MIVEVGEHPHGVWQSRQNVTGRAALVIHHQHVQHPAVHHGTHPGDPTQQELALPRTGAADHHRVRAVANDVQPHFSTEAVVPQQCGVRRAVDGRCRHHQRGRFRDFRIAPSIQSAHHGIGGARIEDVDAIGIDHHVALGRQFVTITRHHDHAFIASTLRIFDPTGRLVHDHHRVRRAGDGILRVRQARDTDGATDRSRPRSQTPIRWSRTHGEPHDHGAHRVDRHRSVHAHHYTRREIDHPRHFIDDHVSVGARHLHGFAPSAQRHVPHVVVPARPPMPQSFVAGGHQRW